MKLLSRTFTKSQHGGKSAWGGFQDSGTRYPRGAGSAGQQFLPRAHFLREEREEREKKEKKGQADEKQAASDSVPATANPVHDEESGTL